MALFDEANPLVPGEVRAEPAPYNHPRPFTASAVKLKLGTKAARQEIDRPETREWQRLAWQYYDAIGEVKFAFNLVASVMSRIRLYPAIVHSSADVPQDATAWLKELAEDSELNTDDTRKAVEATKAAIAQLDGAGGGISEMLRAAALNANVPGEMFLVNFRGRWMIVSVDELRRDGNTYALVASRDGKVKLPLDKDAYVARIWRNHPRWSREPDSSMLGALDQCEKLVLIDKALRASARSRLNAGAMFIPDGVSAPGSDEDSDEAEDIQTLEDQLLDAWTAPIEDEAAATTVVPFIMRGPKELGDSIKRIEIARLFDEQLVNESERSLDRVLSSIDVPKDTVTGLADVKYANAIVIDDNLYRAHVEPLALLFVDSLTKIFLRPLLKKAGVPKALLDRLVIWYDPSSVVTRPDRSQAANEGHDRGVISDAAWRAARGFSETDAPDPDELLRRMAFKGQLQPGTVESLLQFFAPEAWDAIRQRSQDANVPDEVQQALNAPKLPGQVPEAAPDNDQLAPGGTLPPVPGADQ